MGYSALTTICMMDNIIGSMILDNKIAVRSTLNLPGSQKKRKLPLIKLLIVYFELNWQAYAATIGASQPSVFNFFRYAFILRSLLN